MVCYEKDAKFQPMSFRHETRKSHPKPLINLLLIDDGEDYVRSLKNAIEESLLAQVAVARNLTEAKKLLKSNPDQFFIGISSVTNMDSSSFEQIDLMGEYNLSVIAIVNDYEDEMRDLLVKRHAVDYITLANNPAGNAYVCDLIKRIYKNTRIKVMVVDDSTVSRFVMARELVLQKFQVIEVSNGNDALKMLKEQPDIKLALVDQQMPDIQGTVFVERARKLYPKDRLIIIGLSTSSDPRLSVKFLKAGANDFVAKPFNYEILLCRINQNLEMMDAVDLAKKLSNTDFLTGLSNRRYFFEQGNKVLKYIGHSAALTVMMVDIDHFKRINDLYGHDVGDEVIKNMATLLKTYFPDDIVARIGGEEFAVISKLPEYVTSAQRIEDFRLSVENQLLTLNDDAIQYTCSIGVCNTIKDDLDAMLVEADKNLYIAKEGGRNRVVGDFS